MSLRVQSHSKDSRPGEPESASYKRFLACRSAFTKGELGLLTGARRADVKWDLSHHYRAGGAGRANHSPPS